MKYDDDKFVEGFVQGLALVLLPAIIFFGFIWILYYVF